MEPDFSVKPEEPVFPFLTEQEYCALPLDRRRAYLAALAARILADMKRDRDTN